MPCRIRRSWTFQMNKTFEKKKNLRIIRGKSFMRSRHPSLRTEDAFPVVASLPPKNSVCESERQNDFRDVKPFALMWTNQIKG